MKNLFRLWMILMAVISCSPLYAQDIPEKYRFTWAEADSAWERGNVDSTMMLTRRVFATAKADNHAGMMYHATMRVYALMEAQEEGYHNHAVLWLDSMMAGTAAPGKNVLHLARSMFLMNYLNSESWRITQYPDTGAAASGTDMKIWSEARFKREILRDLQLVLSDDDVLKSLAVTALAGAFEESPEARPYRPTLYDMLVSKVAPMIRGEIDIHPEQAALTESFLFLPASDFVRFEIPGTDISPNVAAFYRIMQNWIGFHLNDKNPEALVEADLSRLNLCLPDRTDATEKLYQRQMEAISKMAERHSGHEVSAWIHSIHAGYLRHLLTPKDTAGHNKVLDICRAAASKWPGSRGGKACEAIAAEITLKNLDMHSREFNYPDQPVRLQVNYRNLPKIYIKAVRVTLDDFIAHREKPVLAKGLDKELLLRKGEKSFTALLPGTEDYQQHNTEVAFPGLPEGLYALIASDDSSFRDTSRIYVRKYTTVSKIGYLFANTNTDTVEVLVTDNWTGAPLQGVQAVAVKNFFREDLVELGTSDKEGVIRISRSLLKGKEIILKLGNSECPLEAEGRYPITLSGYKGSRTTARLFTDRSIYRPGQTVYFKCIYLEDDGKKTWLKAGDSVKISLHRYRVSEPIHTLEMQTNDFGSVAGAFQLPEGATGRFSIRCNGDWLDDVLVEEYKRPKLELTIDDPEGQYLPGDSVTVTGKAVLYSGAPASGAIVKYTVTRTNWSDYSDDDYEFREYDDFGSDESFYTADTFTCKPDGSFRITFITGTCKSKGETARCVESYYVEITVTDISGETKTGSAYINVSKPAIEISASFPDGSDLAGEVKLNLSVIDRQGKIAAAVCEIKIEKLKDPGVLVQEYHRHQTPDHWLYKRDEYYKLFPDAIYKDEKPYQNWEVEKWMTTLTHDSKKGGEVKLPGTAAWEPGIYRLTISAKDKGGNPVQQVSYSRLGKTGTHQLPYEINTFLSAGKLNMLPGENTTLAFHAPVKEAWLYVEIEYREGRIEKKWMKAENGNLKFDVKSSGADAENIFVRTAWMYKGMSFQTNSTIRIMAREKDIKVTVETFRDKLRPGAKEEWRIRISGEGGEKVAAELLASMYDQSLDAFTHHYWNTGLNMSRYPLNKAWREWEICDFMNMSSFYYIWSRPEVDWPTFRYEMLPDPIGYYGPNNGWQGDQYIVFTSSRNGGGRALADESYDWDSGGFDEYDESGSDEFGEAEEFEGKEKAAAPFAQSVIMEAENGNSVNPGSVQIRKNLQETAFFYPQLRTDTDGAVIFSFTMPEALTRWRLMLFAHNKEVFTGYEEKTLVTQKELMVMPNAPRFVREGDMLTFTSQVSNLSGEEQRGTGTILLTDALTGKDITSACGISDPAMPFLAEKGGAGLLAWTIRVPNGVKALTWRVVASTPQFSDGEESTMPVLSRRMLLTESMPMHVKGNSTKTFSFSRLKNATSATLEHHNYTLEFTSNPVWTAIQSLPYLMEYPHECTEQRFSRYFANALAAKLVQENPAIKKVFDEWKKNESESLVSKLEANSELKGILLEETPWLRDAASEAEQKKRLALLFDLSRMAAEKEKVLSALETAQESDGGFSWFPGMSSSRYITQHVLQGLGKLHYPGKPDGSAKLTRAEENIIQRAVDFINETQMREYQYAKADTVSKRPLTLTGSAVEWLYSLSWHPKYNLNLEPEVEQVKDAYMAAIKRQWKVYSKSRTSLAMLALILHRNGENGFAQRLIKYLRTTSLRDEEEGMYWKRTQYYYGWYDAPVEEQALLIRAFHEVTGDVESVEAMKQYLLMQKQTQSWPTTKATTEAVAALLLPTNGKVLETQPVKIMVGASPVDPANDPAIRAEAGTGWFKKSWNGDAVNPAMADVSVTNPNNGFSWGAVYWQYFEDLDKVTSFDETAVKVARTLLVQRITQKGEQLVPITDTTSLQPGDKITVRLQISNSRAMEYVHIKDMRPSGCEPLNVLSGYRWQNGLSYYENTRDATTNFFIELLPEGEFVMEYPLVVVHRGNYSAGVTTLQCMYAPEFTSHSAGVRVKVK